MRYIQVQNGYITDCIDYKHGDYIETETKEKINISGFMTYKDGVIGVDETKKAEIEEAQRLAEEEQEKSQAEGEKDSLKDTIIKQLKNIEEKGIRKKSEYFAAEMIPDEALREAKVATIVAEGQKIANEYQAIVNLLQNDFDLDLKDII